MKMHNGGVAPSDKLDCPAGRGDPSLAQSANDQCRSSVTQIVNVPRAAGSLVVLQDETPPSCAASLRELNEVSLETPVLGAAHRRQMEDLASSSLPGTAACTTALAATSHQRGRCPLRRRAALSRTRSTNSFVSRHSSTAPSLPLPARSADPRVRLPPASLLVAERRQATREVVGRTCLQHIRLMARLREGRQLFDA